MKKQDEGFTLIELLIVIVILGILAVVVVFSVRGITDNSQENSCNTDYRTMEVAVEAYFAQEGGSTVSEAALVSAGLLRAESDNSNVAADGTVTAEATSECVNYPNN